MGFLNPRESVLALLFSLFLCSLFKFQNIPDTIISLNKNVAGCLCLHDYFILDTHTKKSKKRHVFHLPMQLMFLAAVQ